MSAARRRKAVPTDPSLPTSVTRFYASSAAALEAAAETTGSEYVDSAYERNGFLNPVTPSGDDDCWHGTHSTLDDAIEAARTGVDVRVATPPSVTLPTGSGTSRATSYDVAGGRLDVERYRLGEPECMVVRRRRPSPLNVRIAVHNGALADTDAETLRERGRRVLAVLRGLEAAGANVQLDIVSMAVVSGITVTNVIRVKDFGQFVDPRVVAFWIADVSAHRRVGFKLRSKALVSIGRHTQNVGATANPTQASRDAMGWDLYLGSKGVWTQRNLPTVEGMVAEALAAAAKARAVGDVKLGKAENVELEGVAVR